MDGIFPKGSKRIFRIITCYGTACLFAKRSFGHSFLGPSFRKSRGQGTSAMEQAAKFKCLNWDAPGLGDDNEHMAMWWPWKKTHLLKDQPASARTFPDKFLPAFHLCLENLSFETGGSSHTANIKVTGESKVTLVMEHDITNDNSFQNLQESNTIWYISIILYNIIYTI